jgi:predicted metal-dependent hydrolase
MSEQKTPQGILVRKVQAEFPEDIKPYWNPAKRLFSQLANGGSMLLPHMEPFITDSIRRALKYITGSALREEAKAWMGQEAQHFKQHRIFNVLLIAAVSLRDVTILKASTSVRILAYPDTSCCI